MTEKTRSHKDRIVRAYKDFISRKIDQINEIREVTRYNATLAQYAGLVKLAPAFISGYLSVTDCNESGVSEQILGAARLGEAKEKALRWAKERINMFYPNELPRHQQKMGIDSSDLANRVEIWRAGRKDFRSHLSFSQRVHEDPVGSKLYELARVRKPIFCILYKEDEGRAEALLEKMENRTMTEQEYKSIAEHTPRQILKAWQKEWKN